MILAILPDSISGFDTVELQSIEDSRAPAHQWGCIFGGDFIRDLEEEVLLPNGVRTHRSLIEVRFSVHLALSAKGFRAAKALLAMATCIVKVTPANAVISREQCYFLPGIFHGTGSFVTKRHIFFFVMYIGATETAVGYLDEDFSRSDLAMRSGFVDALLATFENCKVDHADLMLMRVEVSLS